MFVKDKSLPAVLMAVFTYFEVFFLMVSLFQTVMLKANERPFVAGH